MRGGFFRDTAVTRRMQQYKYNFSLSPYNNSMSSA